MQTKRQMQNGCPDQASGYERTNKPKIKRKKHKVKEKRKNKQTKNLSKKKEETRTVCVQWDKGLIHVICVHDTTHLAVSTTV